MSICSEHQEPDPDCPLCKTTLNVVAFKAPKQKAVATYNEMLLDSVRGVPAEPGTPETDADPRNPHRK